MNIIIEAVPSFKLLLTSVVTNALCKLSERHYDHTCKAAGRPGGYIAGWDNSICAQEQFLSDLEFNEMERPYVHATFREVDISLKIMEAAAGLPASTFPSETWLQLNEYNQVARRALRRANEIHTDKFWKPQEITI